ncbi:MAG: hypothetical protein HY074_01725 [Deltaproteobacteria bacterium]|nr:hypothetical protein [Deltaproteobacteria bacterium]
MNDNFEARLKSLIEAGVRSRQGVSEQFFDLCPTLAADKRLAWASFLCSIATTESIETMLIEPIRQAFAHSRPILDYLDVHGDDERRHFGMLTSYVKRTFDFEKKHKSTTDVVVYGVLLPRFAKLGRFKPLYLLAPLRFYEAFSLEFYKVLKRLAQSDGLPQLVLLIQQIEKDELRHLAGLDTLVRAHRDSAGAPTRADLVMIRSVLNLLLFDINIAPWAVHNRRVRRNALAIGIDPAQMSRDARGAAEDALQFAGGYGK